MLQERATVANILAKMREIISDELSSAALPGTASRVPELHVVHRDAPLADPANAMPLVIPRSRAEETSGPETMIPSETLEAVFASAIRDAISPTAQRWVNTHRADLISALSPILRQWMDEHLPKLVESVLKEELGRAIGKSLRRST